MDSTIKKSGIKERQRSLHKEIAKIYKHKILKLNRLKKSFVDKYEPPETITKAA